MPHKYRPPHEIPRHRSLGHIGRLHQCISRDERIDLATHSLVHDLIGSELVMSAGHLTQDLRDAVDRLVAEGLLDPDRMPRALSDALTAPEDLANGLNHRTQIIQELTKHAAVPQLEGHPTHNGSLPGFVQRRTTIDGVRLNAHLPRTGAEQIVSRTASAYRVLTHLHLKPHQMRLYEGEQGQRTDYRVIHVYPAERPLRKVIMLSDSAQSPTYVAPWTISAEAFMSLSPEQLSYLCERRHIRMFHHDNPVLWDLALARMLMQPAQCEVAPHPVGTRLSYAQAAAEARAAGVRTEDEYRALRKSKYPYWLSNPHREYRAEGWIDFGTFLGRPTYITDFDDFQQRVRAAGVRPGRKPYIAACKQHPEWPPYPERNFAGKFTNYYDLCGVPVPPERISKEAFLRAVKAEGITSLTAYRAVYKDRPGWPADPGVYGLKFRDVFVGKAMPRTLHRMQQAMHRAHIYDRETWFMFAEDYPDLWKRPDVKFKAAWNGWEDFFGTSPAPRYKLHAQRNLPPGHAEIVTQVRAAAVACAAREFVPYTAGDTGHREPMHAAPAQHVQPSTTVWVDEG